MRISFLSWLYILIGITTLFLYYSINISPSFHWIMAFLPLLVPFFIIINIGFLLYWIIKREALFIIISVIVIAFGFKFIERTYQVSSNDSPGSLKLLNYNVRVFNNYAQYRTPETAPSKLINWVVNHKADIKCFQEFYTYPGFDSFNIVPKVRKNTPYYYFKPSVIAYAQYFGLAIFSKYPIIKKGEVKFPTATFNQAIFADIVAKGDTIRVYNVHLQSMSIDEKKIPSAKSENTWGKVKYLVRKIKRGAIFRSTQVEALLKHMKESPYKIILSGDLNDTPYSYTYEVLRDKFNNGFEEKGNGFGFTYNGKLFFLRIDNVFSDKNIKVNTFKIRKDIRYSDHFPVEVSFTF